MDGNIRKENPHSEQINVPANPTHYWRYRMHIDLDDLAQAETFNHKLKHYIQDSGRSVEAQPSTRENVLLELG